MRPLHPSPPHSDRVLTSPAAAASLEILVPLDRRRRVRASDAPCDGQRAHRGGGDGGHWPEGVLQPSWDQRFRSSRQARHGSCRIFAGEQLLVEETLRYSRSEHQCADLLVGTELAYGCPAAGAPSHLPTISQRRPLVCDRPCISTLRPLRRLARPCRPAATAVVPAVPGTGLDHGKPCFLCTWPCARTGHAQGTHQEQRTHGVAFRFQS